MTFFNLEEELKALEIEQSNVLLNCWRWIFDSIDSEHFSSQDDFYSTSSYQNRCCIVLPEIGNNHSKQNLVIMLGHCRRLRWSRYGVTLCRVPPFPIFVQVDQSLTLICAIFSKGCPAYRRGKYNEVIETFKRQEVENLIGLKECIRLRTSKHQKPRNSTSKRLYRIWNGPNIITLHLPSRLCASL